MSRSVGEFVRRETAPLGLFVATSAAALALSQYAETDGLRTPGRLALAVLLVLSGSLAVVLAERTLDRFLEARNQDGVALYGHLVFGIAILTAAILVFYGSV